MKIISKKLHLLLSLSLILLFAPGAYAQWNAYEEGTQLIITYNDLQHAVLHKESGYFRMVYAAESGWGTSTVVVPSYWSGRRLYQGTSVGTNWYTSGRNIVVHYYGTIGGLYADGKLVISPPRNNQIAARVSVSVSGNVRLDNRPGEAFRPVFLSSMKVSDSSWDSYSAWNGRDYQAIPTQGLMFGPSFPASRVTLDGGSNSWKRNAPSVDVYFDRTLTSMGWVTRSNDPNDDNVGLWLGTNRVLDYYEFTIVTRKR